MRCKKVKRLLPAYLEKDLTPGLMKVMKDHLSKCKDCSQALKRLKKLDVLLRSQEGITPSPDFLDKVHKRIEAPHSIIKDFLFRPIFMPHPAILFRKIMPIRSNKDDRR